MVVDDEKVVVAVRRGAENNHILLCGTISVGEGLLDNFRPVAAGHQAVDSGEKDVGVVIGEFG